jgi:hypothetical protein
MVLQTPPQAAWPVAQATAQVPDWQLKPAPQALPQLPQFALSVRVSVQPAPHAD